MVSGGENFTDAVWAIVAKWNSKAVKKRIGFIYEYNLIFIGRVIESGVASGKKIFKKDLLPYIDEMKSYLANVADEKNLVKEVDDIGKRIVANLADEIPIKEAQKIKQATQNFIKKYYNREAPLKFEVQKQVTRGIKDEIAKQVPEITALNARDKALFGLEEALQKAVTRIGGRNALSLGDMVALGAGGATAGGKGAAALLFFKKILFSPGSQSARAIFYNTLGKNGAKAFSQGRIPVALGIARLLNFFDKD